jgi:hypothetical protein
VAGSAPCRCGSGDAAGPSRLGRRVPPGPAQGERRVVCGSRHRVCPDAPLSTRTGAAQAPAVEVSEWANGAQRMRRRLLAPVSAEAGGPSGLVGGRAGRQAARLEPGSKPFVTRTVRRGALVHADAEDSRRRAIIAPDGGRRTTGGAVPYVAGGLLGGCSAGKYVAQRLAAHGEAMSTLRPTVRRARGRCVGSGPCGCWTPATAARPVPPVPTRWPLSHQSGPGACWWSTTGCRRRSTFSVAGLLRWSRASAAGVRRFRPCCCVSVPDRTTGWPATALAGQSVRGPEGG